MTWIVTLLLLVNLLAFWHACRQHAVARRRGLAVASLLTERSGITFRRVHVWHALGGSEPLALEVWLESGARRVVRLRLAEEPR